MKLMSRIAATMICMVAVVALNVCAFAGAADFPSYDEETVAKYRSLSSEGYNAIEKNDFETAIVKLKAQAELIEGAAGGYYNLACGYSLAGNVEAGVAALQKSVENGWDKLNYVLEDSDLNALRADPAFAGIIAKCESNIAEGDAMLASGLPKYDTAPRTFSDEEALNEWADEYASALKTNSRIWNGWMYTAAKLDASAQRLAALRELKKDDPSFDYGLERIRVLYGVRTIWDCWGSLGGAAVAESKAYLATSPSAAGASEANYLVGYATLLSACDLESAEMAQANKQASDYFKKVSAGSKFYGAAQSWLVYQELQSAGDNPEKVYPQIKKIVSEFKEDTVAARVFGVKFPDEAVLASWPIEINLTDIDGKNVTLADYKGKVLLIDFWATWCGPCRRELPNIKQVYAKYHDKGMEILSVSLDNGKRVSQAEYRKWITEAEMNWRHIYDGKYWDAELSDRYFVNGIPAAFLIGRDGSLVALGEDCYGDKLEQAVENAIASN